MLSSRTKGVGGAAEGAGPVILRGRSPGYTTATATAPALRTMPTTAAPGSRTWWSSVIHGVIYSAIFCVLRHLSLGEVVLIAVIVIGLLYVWNRNRGSEVVRAVPAAHTEFIVQNGGGPDGRFKEAQTNA